MKLIRHILTVMMSFVMIATTSYFVESESGINLFDKHRKDILNGNVSPALIADIQTLGDVINFGYEQQDIVGIKEKMLRSPEYSLFVDKSFNTSQKFQKTSYYCGPATVQCALDYYDYGDPSQKEVAKMLQTTKNGTDIHEIARVLNETNRKGHTYEVTNVYSKEEFAKYIKESLEEGKIVVPEVNTQNMNWPYFTEGHYFVLSGAEIYSKGVDENGLPIEPFGTVTISDPAWAPEEGVNSTYTLDQVYQGIEQFWGQWIVK